MSTMQHILYQTISTNVGLGFHLRVHDSLEASIIVSGQTRGQL